MKFINVHGGSKSQRHLVQAAIEWYMEKYLPKIRNIDIDVELKRFINDDNGYCVQIDEREYNLEINNKAPIAEFITTVMHEMIHVKQYVKNEVYDTPTGAIQWKSRSYNPENLDYWEHPWEKEAHKYDEAIAYDFMIETGRW